MEKKRIYGLALIFFLGIMSFISTEKFTSVPAVNAQELNKPVTSGSAQTLKETGKIYIKDHFIFLNEFYEGIHVIDNKNPYKPEIISFINIPGNVDIAIRDNVLYADSYTDLVVIDISNPTNISEIRRINNVFPFRPRPSGFIDDLDPEPVRGGCFVSGTMVLTARGPRRIEEVTPGTEVHSYDLLSGKWTFASVSKQGAYLYQGDLITIQMVSSRIEATGNHPFYVQKGDNLASRPQSGEISEEEQQLTGSGRWVEARNLKTGDVLKSENDGELIITSLTRQNIKEVVYHLEIEDYHNYAVHQAGILVHNGGNKEMSAPASSTGKGGSLARFTIVGNYLYTLSGSAMQLFVIKNPADPSVWKKVEIGWDIETIFPYEDKLFIGGQQGMYIYDNSNPALPELISRFAHVTSCDPVVVEGNYAYVTLRGGTNCGGLIDRLEIIDISDIKNPELVADYPMDGPYGLGIDGSVLFICDGEGGLKLFDVSDVHKLRIIGVIDDIYPLDVILTDKRAVVVEKYGLNQYDYQDPGNVKLISRIPNVNAKNENGESVLLVAAINGNIESIRILLEAGADIKMKDHQGRTALQLAALGGHVEIMKILLQAGANVNMMDYLGRTALQMAAFGGHIEVMNILLKAGANVNIGDNYGRTALVLAADCGHLEVVNILLHAEADANTSDEIREKAVIKAAEGGYTEIVKLLMEAGFGVYENGLTALISVSQSGLTGIVKILLDTGIDVNKRSRDGFTALMGAAEGGYSEIVQILLEAGADMNLKNRWDRTALMIARHKEHTEVMKVLLEAGSDVDARDKTGRTSLMWAASYNHPEIVNILLQAGADVNAREEDGWTALMYAAQSGRSVVVPILIQAGSEMNSGDGDTGTALMMAAGYGHVEVVQILLQAGADMNAKNMGEKTALMLAKEKGHDEVVNLLNKSQKKLVVYTVTVISFLILVVFIGYMVISKRTGTRE